MKRIFVLVLSMGVALSFFSCDLLKEAEEALKAPSVSVPEASNLNNYNGTASSDKNTNLSLLQNIMNEIDNNVNLESSLHPKKLSQKAFEEVIVNETFNNEAVVPGIKASGKAYAKLSGTIDPESETYQPAPGDYLQIDVDFDLTLTVENYSASNIYVNGSYYNLTLNGTSDHTMKLMDKFTISSDSIKINYSIQYGFGYALSISNANTSGPAGKFILTVAYAKENSATITQANQDTFDYEGFFTPSSNEITGGKLTVYNNSNTKVAEFSLTTDELAHIIPSTFYPGLYFEGATPGF